MLEFQRNDVARATMAPHGGFRKPSVRAARWLSSKIDLQATKRHEKTVKREGRIFKEAKNVQLKTWKAMYLLWGACYRRLMPGAPAVGINPAASHWNVWFQVSLDHK